MLEYNTCSRCALGRPIDCRATLRLDYASGKFKHIALVPGRAVHVRALLEDPRGPLWIGTDTGLWQLDPLSGSVTKRAMGCLGDERGGDEFVVVRTPSEIDDAARLAEETRGSDMALYRAKVCRDAWLGWCVLPRAARQIEIFRLVSADPRGAMRDGYIDVRASRRNDETASVHIPTLRMRSL